MPDDPPRFLDWTLEPDERHLYREQRWTICMTCRTRWKVKDYVTLSRCPMCGVGLFAHRITMTRSRRDAGEEMVRETPPDA